MTKQKQLKIVEITQPNSVLDGSKYLSGPLVTYTRFNNKKTLCRSIIVCKDQTYLHVTYGSERKPSIDYYIKLNKTNVVGGFNMGYPGIDVSPFRTETEYNQHIEKRHLEIQSKLLKVS